MIVIHRTAKTPINMRKNERDKIDEKVILKTTQEMG